MKRLVFAAIATLLAACLPDPPNPPKIDTSTMGVGQTRSIELRFLRFDVTDYAHELSKADILALPQSTQQRLWLFDLDLSNGPNAPRLLDNSIAQIKSVDPTTLSPAAQNLQKLLLMTPANADLKGTTLEQLTEIAPLLGIAPEQVLADLLGVHVDDTVLSSATASQAILDLVIATHPNAQTRLGPITVDNPTGIYPVAAGSLPVTLADAASDFADLSTKFGPYNANGVRHPGFITGTTSAQVLTDDFKMKVKASANALPYKGVDLSSVTEASVNSVRSQIREIFDFSDPSWLEMTGLVPGIPVIHSLTFQVTEDPMFIPGGRSPLPTAQGDSPAWKLPPWELERVLIGGAASAFANQSTTLNYYQPGHTDPIFSAVVDHGWQDLTVEANIGSPPPPSYLWDILVEVGQVRLHDGGIPEGQANVEITLQDVPVGIDSAAISDTIRANLEADPIALVDIARTIIDNGSGNADFYYYRPLPTSDPQEQGDWLFFLAAGDIEVDDQGQPVRPYSYTNPGFFSDAALTQKVSDVTLVDGDTDHEKIRIATGDVLYAQGADGSVYRLKAGDKASLDRCSLTVTRVQ